MPAYQYKREPLTGDEANQLANACANPEEQLIISLRPRVAALESHVIGLAESVAALTSATIHYELAS